MTGNPGFGPTSRYHLVDTATWEAVDGREIAYLRRRFVPPPEQFALVTEYVVGAGDRLDNITAREIGDPEQFWRICDANVALRPDELTEEPGRRLRITLPAGIPGVTNG
jgi:hypothetical protein